MTKSTTEIKNEILSELKIGIDANDGSFISSLVGAIATQIVMLDQAVQDVKTQQYPEFADMETLVLLGRKCGLFPMAATPSQISIEIIGEDPNYAEGTAIRFRDSDWSYSVLKHDGERKYTLECVTVGAASNEIPPSWYSAVTIEPDTAAGTPEITAKVLAIQRHGRDPEDINQFRLRVMAAHNVAPVAANDHWLRTVLMQGDLPIGCVRIKTPTILTAKSAAMVHIYVGGMDFEGVTPKIVDDCAELLGTETPIGTQFEVHSVHRLDHASEPNELVYTLKLSQDRVEYEITQNAKVIFSDLIREYIRDVVSATDPRKNISIVPSEMVGVLRKNDTIGQLVISAAITYRGHEYTSTPCEFAIDHVPWVSEPQLKFVSPTDAEIATGLKYPTF